MYGSNQLCLFVPLHSQNDVEIILVMRMSVHEIIRVTNGAINEATHLTLYSPKVI